MTNNRSRAIQNSSKYEFEKDSEGNLLITYYKDEKKTETVCLEGFKEGDYGLWVAEEAPYIIEDSKVIRTSTGEKAGVNEVLGLEENQFLKEEDRIQNDFLWIHATEKIVFPKDEEKNESNATKEESSGQEKNQVSTDADTTKGGADKNPSTSNQTSTGNNEAEANQDSSSGGGQLYVCGGAELKCSCGDQTSNLQVVSGHNAKVCGNLIANIMDYKPMTNIMPFGNCQTTSNPQVAAATSANGGVLAPQPCVPNIPAPWAKVKADVKVGQQAALLEGSRLTCAYGGQIEIVDPGQSILQE
ncbi:MAG: DUF4280 domain-containing protein [Bacillota bacterium]